MKNINIFYNILLATFVRSMREEEAHKKPKPKIKPRWEDGALQQVVSNKKNETAKRGMKLKWERKTEAAEERFVWGKTQKDYTPHKPQFPKPFSLSPLIPKTLPKSQFFNY